MWIRRLVVLDPGVSFPHLIRAGSRRIVAATEILIAAGSCKVLWRAGLAPWKELSLHIYCCDSHCRVQTALCCLARSVCDSYTSGWGWNMKKLQTSLLIVCRKGKSVLEFQLEIIQYPRPNCLYKYWCDKAIFRFPPRKAQNNASHSGFTIQAIEKE